MTTPTITQSHVDKACGELYRAKVHDYLQLKNVDICNKAIEIALAEQQEITAFAKKRSGMEFDEWQGKPPPQESEYITAAQARGKFKDGYLEVLCENGETIKYPAIKPPQPEPVDPHADLRAEYAKQVKEGTTGFYLWEFIGCGAFVECTEPPKFANGFKYRYTDISCYVSKDGEPAIRMLRTEAQKLHRKLGDTVDWSWCNFTIGTSNIDGKFDETDGTYTYRTKATIMLDGNMVTPEQAAAEWKAKKKTHDLWINATENGHDDADGWLPAHSNHSINKGFYYQLRLNQPTWTGSRADVIALLKEMELL